VLQLLPLVDVLLEVGQLGGGVALACDTILPLSVVIMNNCPSSPTQTNFQSYAWYMIIILKDFLEYLISFDT
jgi:hypothetical protein